jgi:hemolysin activation/secretion protein
MRQPAKIGQLLGITWLALAPVIVCLPSLPQDEMPQVPSQPAGAGGFPLSESFLLKEVRLLDSTVFSPQEVKAVVAPFLGKSVTVGDLFEIQELLTDLYLRKGYQTSLVILPLAENQALDGGVVVYRALEGQLAGAGGEKISVAGLHHLSDSYVRERLLPYATTPLNVYKLEEGLQLLKENPLLSEVNAELIPSGQPGYSQWVVTVKEAPLWRVGGEGSNDENPAVGDWGGKLFLENRNVFGLGDKLAVEYKRTEGLERFLATASLPLNPQDGTLQLAYQLTDSKIVADVFKDLGIRNDAQTISLNLTQPLIKNLTDTFQLGWSLDYQENQSYILENFPFSLSEGIRDGFTQLTAFRFTQTYQNRSSESLFLANSQFTVGFSNLAVNPTFFTWQGQVQWLKKLGDDAQFYARLASQLSPNVVPGLEQCAVGGQNGNLFIFGNTVRGYATNTRSGDNCLAISLELRLNVVQDDTWGTVQFVPFADLGTVWDSEGEVFSPNTLLGAGVGLRWRIRENLSLRLDYGIPLIDVPNPDLEEQRWSFSLWLGTGF